LIRKCHKQDDFKRRIEAALGVSMGEVSCSIVDQDGMSRVMSGAGWSRNESLNVVGFQVHDKVYVLDSAPWTVLHELVHRAGVNSDRLNRFVAEGLTEAIARELKSAPDEHRATYPSETRWVIDKLLPRLGMSAVELGSVIAKSEDPPRDLARMMAASKPGTDESALRRQLRPQTPDQPSWNGVTRVGVEGPGDLGYTVGLLLMASGAVMVLPTLFSRSSR
jgi:hypothetical protein